MTVPAPMRLAALSFAFLAAAGAHAQGQNNYGSVYSRYGLGERVEFGSSQAAMLGYSGVGLRSGTYVQLTNPALWSDQTVTTFSAGASVATVRGQDATTPETTTATAGDLASLHLGVPLIPARLGAVVAYRPYSRVNYRAAVRGSIMVEQDTVLYTLNQEGSGGLQQISGGVGVRVGRSLQLGATADYLFGTQEQLQRTQFDDGRYLEARQSRATRLRGLTATLGAAFTAAGLARDDDALTAGAAVTLPTSLDGQRTVVLGESLDRDTLGTSSGDVDLPLSVRGGLSYRSGQRWAASVDGLFEPWGGFESALPVGGYEPGGQTLLTDRYRVGGGFEITPSGRERRAGVFQRSSYRVGGYAERGLYAPTADDVMTYALTGGVSVPSRITGARLDLGVEVGTRGSTAGVLVRDSFLRGTVTLNFGERWFVRRRFN